MEQDLKNEARSALAGAAERLGVDPFRLARFLSDGQLADILMRVREADDQPLPKTVALAESYLEFLEHEIALRDHPGPASSGDGSTI